MKICNLFIKNKIFYMNKLWILCWCALRELFRLHLCPQILHWNGFSPVWIRICLLASQGFLIIFGQYGHPYCPGEMKTGSTCKKILEILKIWMKICYLFCTNMIIYMNKLWIFCWWVFKISFRLNFCPQILHWNGFSPVWILICFLIS